MKKKTVKRTKRVSRKKSTSGVSPIAFSFKRILIITTCIALVAVAVLANKNKVTQSVAGVSIARGFFTEVKVGWDRVEGAASYNLYYKEDADRDFTNAVRDIPSDLTEYTVSYLLKGKDYDYKVAAVGPNGEEFFWTGAYEISKPESM